MRTRKGGGFLLDLFKSKEQQGEEKLTLDNVKNASDRTMNQLRTKNPPYKLTEVIEIFTKELTPKVETTAQGEKVVTTATSASVAQNQAQPIQKLPVEGQGLIKINDVSRETSNMTRTIRPAPAVGGRKLKRRKTKRRR